LTLIKNRKLGIKSKIEETWIKAKRHKPRFDKPKDDWHNNWKITDKITRYRENPSRDMDNLISDHYCGYSLDISSTISSIILCLHILSSIKISSNML